jgi:hypothetical protein
MKRCIRFRVVFYFEFIEIYQIDIHVIVKIMIADNRLKGHHRYICMYG